MFLYRFKVLAWLQKNKTTNKPSRTMKAPTTLLKSPWTLKNRVNPKSFRRAWNELPRFRAMSVELENIELPRLKIPENSHREPKNTGLNEKNVDRVQKIHKKQVRFRKFLTRYRQNQKILSRLRIISER